MKKLILSVAFVISGILAHQAGAQTTQWWDNNGTSPATDGTWDTTSTNWTESATLAPSTDLFTNGNYVIFAAGSGITTTMNISVAEAVTCTGLGDGTTSTGTASGAYITTLNLNDGGGSINLPAGTWPIECGNGTFPAGIYITATIAGPGGIAQHNGAGLALYGNNTYSGGTVATGGQIIYFNNANSFGSGPISTSGGSTTLWNQTGNIITLTNAFNINSGTTVLNWAGGNAICSGPWTLGTTPQLKNNAPNTPLTISGPISGAFGLQPQCNNPGATITLSGPNTYSGQTSIGWLAQGATTVVNVSNINSVTTPAPQPSSSLGVPSSAANGTIRMGYGGFPGQLTYTGPGETSDRVISLTGTTGASAGAIIEMDGTGPLVLTSSFTVPTNGATKTLTLQGSSAATNTIAGVIPNPGSGAVNLRKAQSGTWVLLGANTYTGGTTVSNGILSVNAIADSGASAIGNSGGLTNSGGTLQYTGSANATTARAGLVNGPNCSLDLPAGNLEFTGQVKGANTGIVTKTSAGTLTLSGTTDNSSLGVTVGAGTVVLNKTSTGSVHAVGQTTTVNSGGTLQLAGSGNDQIYTGVSVQVDGLLDMNGHNEGFKQLLGGGTVGNTSSGNCTLQIGESSGQGTFNGQITDGTGGGQTSLTIANSVNAQVLTGVNTYGGATIINGNLTLSGSGSINNSVGISLAAGATFNVSSLSSFALSANNTFFTAIGSATKTATIVGPSAANVDFSSKPLNLSFVPSSPAGDLTNAALAISQGTLLLNGNTINVTNASALNLGAGTYTLIQATNGGLVSATSPLTLNYFGTALAPATAAALAVDGSGNLNLVITSTAAPGSFTGVARQPDGTMLLSFSGTAGANYVIQSATNLVAPVIWTPISTNTPGIDGTFQYNDLTASNIPVQFYRTTP